MKTATSFGWTTKCPECELVRPVGLYDALSPSLGDNGQIVDCKCGAAFEFRWDEEHSVYVIESQTVEPEED